MKTLEQALHDHELIVLRVIGEWWELNLTGSQKRECIQQLTKTLSALDMQREIDYLGPEESVALIALVQSGGQMPVGLFEREHGPVRRMGPGRMEREEPWLDPVSPAEALWYRGFLYQAFDEIADNEMVEYFYLPEEFNDQFDTARVAEKSSIAYQDNYLEPVAGQAEVGSGFVEAVDDLTAMLAAAQLMPLREGTLAEIQPLLLNNDLNRASLLLTLAWQLNLLRLTDNGVRPAKAAVSWLKKSREGQLRDLIDAWSTSSWNELRHTPHLVCDGSGWENDPLLGRTALLTVLPRVSGWYRLTDLVDLIKQNNPDFQRPGGNYDTWYIRESGSDQYITGFENWALVEGQLLAYLVTGPMVWLGLVETSLLEDTRQLIFYLTPRALAWLANTPPASQEVTIPIVVHDDASLAVPFNANRYHRFQVARISEAEPIQPGQPFYYRLTPGSLSIAREQGIDTERLISFMIKASSRPLPPGTERAIRRWSEKGIEGRLEDVVILRVGDPEVLEKLRANPKTQPYLAEALGDLAIVVRRNEWPKLRQAAARLGLLLDFRAE